MSDSLPPVAKSSCDTEIRPSEGSEPGTVDHLNEAPQLTEACQRFVQLGDDPGIFMTCNSDSFNNDYRVNLKCHSLKHAQAVHRAIIDIVKSVRDGQRR